MTALLKRILPMAAALCLLLAACSSGGKAPFDPTATSDAFLKSEAFTETLEAMDLETVCMLYGLDYATVSSGAAYGSLSAGAEELAVFALQDEDCAKAALEALQRRVEDQKQVLSEYQPGEVSKLDSAIVAQRGSSVLLVVPGDSAKAQAVLDGLD